MKAKKLQSPLANKKLKPKNKFFFIMLVIFFPPKGGIGFHHFLLESDEK